MQLHTEKVERRDVLERCEVRPEEIGEPMKRVENPENLASPLNESCRAAAVPSENEVFADAISMLARS